MKSITNEQIKILHTLLNQLGLLEEKKSFVYDVSNGRTESTKELTIIEARQLIQHLRSDDSGDKMRRKVFALAYNADIIWGETDADKKMNLIKINKFLKEKGTVKKELHKMTNAELIKVVNQFEQIVRHKKESQASKATKSLLEELNIESSFSKVSK